MTDEWVGIEDCLMNKLSPRIANEIREAPCS